MTSDKTNSFWLGVQFITATLISLVTLKLNLNYFGEELFGVWILISSLWGLGTIIDLGFGITVIKKMAELKNTSSPKIKELLATSFYSFLILGTLLCIVIFVLGKIIYLSNQKLIPPNFYTDGLSLLLVLGIGFFIRFINIFFKSYFEGQSDFKKTSIIGIIGSILNLIFVVLIVTQKLSIIYLAWSYTLTSLLSAILLLYFYNKSISLNSISFVYFNFAKLKELLRFSIGVQGATISGRMIDLVIKYLTGIFYSLEYVSYYEIAFRFVSALSGIFNSAFRIILPKTSILKTRSEYFEFFENYGFKIQEFGIVYAGFVYGVCGIFFALFINYWFGYEEAILIFMILALPDTVNKFGYLLYNFYMGIGKVYFLFLIQFTNLITITIGLYAGFMIFNNILGLLGYFLTIILVNILMIGYMKKIGAGFYFKVFKSTIFYKFILFLLILIASVLISYYSNSTYLLVFALLSFATLILFYREFLFHINKFFLLWKKR